MGLILLSPIIPELLFTCKKLHNITHSLSYITPVFNTISSLFSQIGSVEVFTSVTVHCGIYAINLIILLHLILCGF